MIQRCLLVVALIVAWPPVAEAEQDDKIAIPPAPAQQQARKSIHEVYAEDYKNANTDKEKQALAKKLLGIAATSEDTKSRYVLLEEARRLAIEGKDGETAFRAVDETGKVFQVDALRLKGSTLFLLTKEAKTKAQHESIAEQSLVLMDQAVADDDYATAKNFANMALAEAREARDTDLIRRSRERTAEIEEIAGEYAKARDAEEKLKTTPTDPDANLMVGRFRCFFKAEWERGLPMLALGGDSTLKALALNELEGVTDTSEQVNLADGWWDVAEETVGGGKRRLRGRAAYWYQQAAPKLTDKLVRDRVEKRLESLTKVVDLVPLIDVRRDVIGGSWKKTRDGVLCPLDANVQRPGLRVPFRVPSRFTLSMTVERKQGDQSLSVALPISGKYIWIVVDITYKSNKCSGIGGVDGQVAWKNSTTRTYRKPVLPMGKSVALDFICDPALVAIQLDGRSFVEWRLDAIQIPGREVATSEPRIILGSFKTSFEFRDIQLKFIDEK